MRIPRHFLFCGATVVSLFCFRAPADSLEQAAAGASILSKALTFHASFDRGGDADFALGDRRVYTATSYKKREDTQPGIGNPDVVLAPEKGRFGGALEFKKKNTKAIFFKAERNVSYNSKNWSGTVSFWLSLDPDRDLDPGYCDPIQVTDEDYNDGALWVDFSKDEKPRLFRLGVFGDLKAWNPKEIGPDKNPDFMRRLLVVTRPPFSRGQWTHVVIAHSALNTEAGVAKLYLNGKLQATTEKIREPFTWDLSRAAIRLGLNYTGFYYDLAVFSRELDEKEVDALHRLEKGAASLHP
jgi:hypothetical protein